MLDGTVEPPMPSQSEQQIGTLGAKPPQEQLQQPQNTLDNNEWQRLLELGRKSPLDLTDEEFNETRQLSARGKQLLGNRFNEELAGKKLAAQQEQRKIAQEEDVKRLTPLFSKLDAIGADSKAQGRQIVEDFGKRQEILQAESDRKLASIEEEIKNARNKPIEIPTNDPKLANAKAEIDWINTLAGNPIRGELPQELKDKIESFRANAKIDIFKDPEEYQERLAVLKGEFLQARGITLPQK